MHSWGVPLYMELNPLEEPKTCPSFFQLKFKVKESWRLFWIKKEHWKANKSDDEVKFVRFEISERMKMCGKRNKAW